jgi:hypothetical protein
MGPVVAARRNASSGIALLIVCVAAGCATDLERTPTGFRHREHGYSIGFPNGVGPAWTETDVEGAWIAFRRPGRETIALQSRCGRPVAAPAVMARNLVVGVGERDLLQAGPVAIGGSNGWVQTFDVTAEGVEARVTTVTAVIADCTFDWTLVTKGEPLETRAAFDTWWATFELDPDFFERAERRR